MRIILPSQGNEVDGLAGSGPSAAGKGCSGDGAPRGGASQQLLMLRVVEMLDAMRRNISAACRQTLALGGPEWRIILQVGDNPPMSQTELGRGLNLDPAQLSRTIKALVARGLLESHRRPGGREVMVTLTTEGQRVQTRTLALISDWNHSLLTGMEPEQVEAGEAMIGAIMQHARLMIRGAEAQPG